MKIQLSDNFTYPRLIRFVMPSVIMMIFTSIYGIVDGLFVSNFVGKTQFAAINLIMPALIMVSALGFMIGAGGTAIIARTLGEGDKERANSYFSMLVYTTVILGAVISVLGIVFLRPISEFLGAEGDMLDYCVLYGRINLIAMPCFMLQNVFQSFFVTAEKPKLGLAVTVTAGCTNMVLDALFVAVFKFGLAGAAVATAASQAVGAIIPILYFARQNTSPLKLGKTKFRGRIFLKTCTNGSSELMSNISMSLVTMLYNFQLMKYAGENGIAAYGVIMYVGFLFVAVFIGFTIGISPIVSFHYGAGNSQELKNMLKKSVIIISVTGAVMMVLAIVTSRAVSGIFVGYDAELYDMTVHGFRIYAISFLFCGLNIFGSAFFTALNNGLISAVISFLRTLVFQLICISIMPILFEMEGIWFSVVAAEILSLAVTMIFICANKKKYKYM